MNRKLKRLIYVGIILLSIGLALRYFSEYQILATLLIAGGILGKVAYLLIRLKSKFYKPGIELLFLITGLALFFLGLYLKSANGNHLYIYFMLSGILLKVVFVIKFIKKT